MISVYDNSSGHNCMAKDALSVSKLNLGVGGKNPVNHWESWQQKVTKINKINKDGVNFNLLYCTAVVLLTFVEFC